VSGSASRAEREFVMRDTSLVVFFWIGVAALVASLVLFGTPLLGGTWSFLPIGLPPALFVSWVLWFVLFRPQLRYTSAHAIVINMGRVYEIPWHEVAHVRQRLALVFELVNGKTVQAAGVSAPRGPGVIVGSVTGRLVDGSPHFNQNADALEAVRGSAAPTDAVLVSRWDTVPLIVGGALLLLTVIDLALVFSVG
jgi:hypothetical protein